MPSEESRLPSIFYSVIDKVSNDLWMKFVRLLGLAEGDIKHVSSKDRGLIEKKYQTLNRWKMFVGAVTDADVEDILKWTLMELDHSREYNCRRYHEKMKQSIAKARKIYRFIEIYSTEQWNITARRLLELSEPDIIRIKDTYEDFLEVRYQMVLRFSRVSQIDDERLLQRLDEFIAHPLGDANVATQPS